MPRPSPMQPARSRPRGRYDRRPGLGVVAVIALMLLCSLSTLGSTGTEEGSFSPPALPIDVAGAAPVGTGRFTENLGQWPDHVGLVAPTSFGQAVLGAGMVTYDVSTEKGGHRVNLLFGDHAVEPRGEGDAGFPSNYFLGKDPEGWVTDARSYREVVYEDAWPGVDVRYRFDGDRLKYDLLLDADADPSVIRFTVEGAEGLEATGDALSIRLAGGMSVEDRDLVAWYADGEAVDARFRLDGIGAFGFDVDSEAGRPMVIDPVVVHSSTLIGGSYGDSAEDVKVDRFGNVYITGATTSNDFPVTEGAYSTENQDGDIMVTKLSRNCSRVLWATFIGGSNTDFSTGLDIDDRLDVYIAGFTWSSDFPVTKGAVMGEMNRGLNTNQLCIWVAKLNKLGDELVYSTYMGGSSTDRPADIKVWNGRAAVVGSTHSYDFITEYGSYGGVHGDGFLFILNENGTAVEHSQFWGGFGSEAVSSLAVDGNGDIVIGGGTTSDGIFTTPGAFQSMKIGFSGGFVARYSPSEDRLVMSTYVSGGASSSVGSVAVDDDLNVYLSGSVQAGGVEPHFITTEGAYDRDYNGWVDSFLAKLDPNGTRLEYCTLLGGDGKDYVYDIEVDGSGNLVVVGGLDDGTNFTVTADAHDDEWAGDSEGYIFCLNADGSAPVYSSFHGGSRADLVNAVVVDPVDNWVVASSTDSMDFPIEVDGFQQKLKGNADGAISVIGELLPTSAPLDLDATGREGYIQLDWRTPEDDNGYPVRNYLLLRGTNASDLRLFKVLDAMNAYVDGEVEWGVTYYYALVADNWKGRSPMSNVDWAVSVTVPDPPVNLTALAVMDGVSLNWDPPTFTGGLSVTGYQLYRNKEGDPEVVKVPLDAGRLAYHDTGLEDGKNYTYNMTALNSYGESRSFASVTLRTLAVPSPPRDPTYAYGELFIRLRWETPEDDFGLPVTGYEVWRQVEDGPPQLLGSVTAPARTLLDTDVEAGVPYRYYVTAVNAKGASGPSVVVDAMARVRPTPPVDVKATASEQFVRVTWSPPAFDGASPVLGYRVYLGETLEGALSLGGLNVAGLTDLELVFLHDVEYDGVVRSYLVTALNAEGESDLGEVARTRLFEPPDPPSELEVEWGDGDLSLSWQPPGDDGGTPVVLYTIYRDDGTGGGFLPLLDLLPQEIAHRDVQLVNGRGYTYRLTASNLAGESEPSVEVTGVPAGRPGSPVQIQASGGDGTVTVTWQPPPDDGGHDVSVYLVYRKEDGGAFEMVSEMEAGTMELVDGWVTNGQTYTYAVCARTDAGTSSMSQAATAVPFGPPGPPVALMATWLDDRVQLSWSTPTDDGGNRVLGYMVRRDDWDAGNWTELPAEVLVFLDTDVVPGGTYNYTLVAVNAAGQGDGAEAGLTAPPPPPEEPEERTYEAWPWLGLVVVMVGLSVALLVVTERRRRSE